jgi:3-phosphoshikimate 1-carboxyvinyltransferase
MSESLRSVGLAGSLDAKFTAPPSKSVTQRALVLAALASGSSTLLDPLDADDTRTLADALVTLGFKVERRPGQWEVHGAGGKIPSPGATVYAGEAGTAARFLLALVCLGNGRYVVDGSRRMRQRPVGPLVGALQQLGADIRYLQTRGCLPVEVVASGLNGGSVRVQGEQSSQYLSALLLVAPRAASALHLEPEGAVASLPYLQLTGQIMDAFGVAPSEQSTLAYAIDAPKDYPGRVYRIEGDYSSAGYLFTAAAITAGRVHVANLGAESAQADRQILHALGAMGCSVIAEADGWTVRGAPLRPVQCDLTEMPDAAPTLAVASIFAGGTSVFTGLSTLRVKESDRLAALAKELSRLGAGVKEGTDCLEVTPGPLRGACLETYNDHRMAMSLALAGLRVPGVTIRNPECVAKSYPEFWRDFSHLEGVRRGL